MRRNKNRYMKRERQSKRWRHVKRVRRREWQRLERKCGPRRGRRIGR